MKERAGQSLALLLAALASCADQAPTASDAGFVHWIGLDSRPLAVGSKLIVTLDIATDAGLPQFDPDAGGSGRFYTVISTEPDIVGVTDLGSERLLLSVLGEGQTTLELSTPEGKADLAVRASLPAAVRFWDADHYTAGIGGPLNPGESFDLLSSSEERFVGEVLNSDCEPLNSWGLITGRSSLLVSPQPPEQFILAPGASGEFLGGLSDGGGFCDAGEAFYASSASFSIDVVSSADTMQLTQAAPAGLVVLAEATNGDLKNKRVVFGVNDWEFSCAPAETCTIVPLSTSAVGVNIPANSGTHTVFAASSSLALSGTLTIR